MRWRHAYLVDPEFRARFVWMRVVDGGDKTDNQAVINSDSQVVSGSLRNVLVMRGSIGLSKTPGATFIKALASLLPRSLISIVIERSRCTSIQHTLVTNRDLTSAEKGRQSS
jgi:hypothetical protein